MHAQCSPCLRGDKSAENHFTTETRRTLRTAWEVKLGHYSSLRSFEELYIKVVQQEEGSRHDDDGSNNVSNHLARSENKLFAEWTAMS